MKRFLKRSWWLGLTGLIGIVAVVVTIIPLVRKEPPKSERPPSNSISGNCNGQGSNNTVNCQVAVPPPRSISTVSITDAFNPSGIFVFDGPVSEVPTPPDYSLDRTMAHCDSWSDWLNAQPKMYAVERNPYVGLTTGSDDLVVIKDVRAIVFRRTLAATVTLIECNYSGGFTPGWLVVIDTVHQKTEFRRDDDPPNTYHNMPPGSISLNGFMHDTATIAFGTAEKYLYEGMIVVSAEINGKDEKLSLGSVNAPLRWTSGGLGSSPGSGQFIQSLEEQRAYDWNPLQKHWVRVTEQLPQWMPS